MAYQDYFFEFFEINGITYQLEIGITTSNRIYIESILRLQKELKTEQDFETWKDIYKIEYNNKWYIPTKINSWLKFSISPKKKSISWTYKTSGAVGTFGETEEKKEIKNAVTEIVNNLTFVKEYEKLRFVV